MVKSFPSSFSCKTSSAVRVRLFVARLTYNRIFICLLTFHILISSYQLSGQIRTASSVADGFAVVELFTSEGCSSCPPADEAVGRLNGWKNNVYVLSFHVDYWNYLGWKDIFSDPSYSKRQQDYGSVFHLSSIYTPQIIINGKAQFAGSDESRLRKEIEESLKQTSQTEIQIKMQRQDKNKIAVFCNTAINPNLRLNLALVQNAATNFIQRGENRGKSLTHHYIVRDFKVFSSRKDSDMVYLHIPDGLQSSGCTVIAFLQDPKTAYIVAATRSSIPELPHQ
jgi:hypothetical protein